MIEFNNTKDCLTILNSFEIRSRSEMTDILSYIREISENDYIVCRRDIKDMIHEWRAHNLLYDLHIKRERTKDVDLDNEPAWRLFLYKILSFFYIGR